jgi:hypothetical protein
MDAVPQFVNAAEDAELLKTLRAALHGSRRDRVQVAVVSADGKKKRLSRRDDWNLQNDSLETNASLVLMVCRWSSSPLSVGMQFLKDLDLPSAVRMDYLEVWNHVETTLASLAEGKYRCGQCFSTEKVLALGDRCCGQEYCTDVCNVSLQECPSCRPQRGEY